LALDVRTRYFLIAMNVRNLLEDLYHDYRGPAREGVVGVVDTPEVVRQGRALRAGVDLGGVGWVEAHKFFILVILFCHTPDISWGPVS
jgi:hypothetical protein